MNHRLFTCLAGCFVPLLLGALPAFSLQAADRPNIVIILSDDMGWSDIGCMGGEIATPNLDKLAVNGLRFTQFYNTARCCPTRASLLTGLYPHSTGVGHMMEDHGKEGYRGDLNRRCATIAEVLKPAGYRTYAVGKWHVTRHRGPEGPKDNWPLQRGFDRFYGTVHGAGSFFDPATLTRDNTQISAFADPEYQPQTYYYTDAISDHAARFVREHEQSASNQPFFMYVAYTTAHWPMHALPEDIARQRGKYDAGYEPTRQVRLQNQARLRLLDSRWEPAPPVGNWEAQPDKRWEAAGMEVYAAMVESMDRGIGRLIDVLRQTGQLDNTLICYLQDNGGCAENTGRSGTKVNPEQARADMPALPKMAPDALQKQGSIPEQTREGFPVLMGRKVMPGPADTYIAYGEAWAHVSNTPFREYKHWVHEGGIATPLIVHWPAGVPKKRRGQLEAQPGHVVDLAATCVDLAGATYPRERDGLPIHPLAGVSLRPTFSGKSLDRPAPIFWEHEGNRAVRDGRWKAVAKGPGGRWELYDMEADRTEMQDLARKEPERLRQLVLQWETWARASHVLPWIWKVEYTPLDASAPASRP